MRIVKVDIVHLEGNRDLTVGRYLVLSQPEVLPVSFD
jgi:hypothetical protein